MLKLFRAEPTLIISAIVAALEVAQVAVVPMPTWLHGVIAALVVGLGALVNRSQVTPAPAPAGKA